MKWHEITNEAVNEKVFQRGFEETKPYDRYILVAKHGDLPYIPNRRAKQSDQFRIECRKGGAVIAWVNFEIVDDHLEAIDVNVDNKYRRQGIATAMYKFARELGNDIKPSAKQRPLGRAFWSDKTSEVLREVTDLQPPAILDGIDQINTRS